MKREDRWFSSFVTEPVTVTEPTLYLRLAASKSVAILRGLNYSPEVRMSRETNKHLKDLLPGVLKSIGATYQERPDLVLAAWPELVGEKLAPLTQAVAFEREVLTVKVKNSTLYSLLTQHERPKLLKSLQEKFPKVKIKNINFRMG